MEKLSLLRALLLRKLLVKDNERAVALEISYGTIGAGPTNSSDALEDRAERYTLEELARSAPIRLWWDRELCAVVGDKLYLRNRKRRTLEDLDPEGTTTLGDNVACDTYEYQQIRLICREEREE
ncbi:MAG: hypothetical protein E7436_05225 [Ruminococcaceae bacterium]|nr:hypothetical protein [Oscillospiraceae bacterium]